MDALGSSVCREEKLSVESLMERFCSMSWFEMYTIHLSMDGPFKIAIHLNISAFCAFTFISWWQIKYLLQGRFSNWRESSYLGRIITSMIPSWSLEIDGELIINQVPFPFKDRVRGLYVVDESTNFTHPHGRESHNPVVSLHLAFLSKICYIKCDV